MNDTALIIFFKNFIEGRVKTRIAKSTGASKALEIYKRLCAICASVTASFEGDKHVYYSDVIVQEDLWNSKIFQKRLQHKGDLGTRMSAAFETQLALYDKCIIIGTDCPYIEPNTLKNAKNALNNYDLVLGPTYDGGYYLLGMRAYIPDLFQNITWSTDTVLQKTVLIAEKLDLTYFKLPTLQDIDYEEDWLAYRQKNLDT